MNNRIVSLIKYLILCSILIWSCDSRRNFEVNVDNVTFLETQKDNEAPILNLTISSKIDLLSLYEEVGAISMYLFCPLATDDFSANNISYEKLVIKGYGLNENQQEVKESYSYDIPIHFIERNDNGSQEFPMSKTQVYEVLNDKECVKCQIIIARFLRNGYCSKKFCVPVDSLLNQMKF